MANPVRRRKLYYDVVMQGTTLALYFPATLTLGGTGDRYGGLLDALEALSGGSNPETKRKFAVSAVFVPSGSTSANLNATSRGFPVNVDFVQPTRTVANHANVSRIPFLKPGNTTNASFAGQDAVYGTVGNIRHFSVRLFRANASGVAASQSIRGVLYVQRQHSLEV